MVKKLLTFVDSYIHKVIPHPPCEKVHYIGPTITWNATSTTASVPSGWGYRTDVK